MAVTLKGGDFYDGGERIDSTYGPQFRGLNDSTFLVTMVGGYGPGDVLSGNFYYPWGRLDNLPLDFADERSIASYAYAYGQLMRAYGLNLLRTGGHDKWGLDLMYNRWRSDPAEFFKRVRAVCKGLACAGVYTIVELGGMAASGDASTSPPAHQLWQVGTLSWDRYTVPVGTNPWVREGQVPTDNPFNPNAQSYRYLIEYAGDVAKNLYDTPGVVAVEVLNEPEMWANVRDWWYQPAVDSRDANWLVPYDGLSAASFKQWLTRVCNDVKGRAGSSRTMVTMGCSCAQWSGGDIYNYDFRAYSSVSNTAGPDFAQIHLYFPYGNAKAEWGVRAQWRYYADGIREEMAKPLLFSEWGHLGQAWNGEVDAAFNEAGENHCAMLISGMGGYPPTQRTFEPIADVCMNDPLPPCYPTYAPCPAGGEVMTHECVDGALVPTGATCEEPQCALGEEQSVACPDGSWVTTHTCGDDLRWHPTGEVCREGGGGGGNILLPLVIVGSVTAAGFYLLARRRYPF